MYTIHILSNDLEIKCKDRRTQLLSQLIIGPLSPLSRIQDAVLGRLQKLIQDQVVTALQEQQAAISDQLLNTVVATMRSQAPTPVPGPAPTSAPPTPDPQQLQAHVLQLLRQGQLNAAFQQVAAGFNILSNYNISPLLYFDKMVK